MYCVLSAAAAQPAMNSLQRELQALTAQIEEQDDLLRPLEAEVEKTSKRAMKECVRDDVTVLGREIWKELDGLSDDLRRCRDNAFTSLRAASRQVSTKKLRVRLRLSNKIVKEKAQLSIVTSRGQKAAVESIIRASHDLDACKAVGAYARRSIARLAQCAKNRVKVVESQTPSPQLPPRPTIADAEAAFASAGLRTPDAVEDCLVCWDFMTSFRGSAILPARSEQGFLMLPETRLDEFAAALQAPNCELIKRPAQNNPFRYLAHVHCELLKQVMNDDETEKWWPSPKKSYGPRWWARPDLPSQPLLIRFNANGDAPPPSRTMCQIGAIQATGQPVPVPLLALALQELHYPHPVVQACAQGHPLGQEILLKVGRAAQDAHRATLQSEQPPRQGQASAAELAAFRAFQDSKRAAQAAQDAPSTSPPRPAKPMETDAAAPAPDAVVKPEPAPDAVEPAPPPAPAVKPEPPAAPAEPSAAELHLRAEVERLRRANAALKTPASAVQGAVNCAEGALKACGKAGRKCRKVVGQACSRAAKTAVEAQPTRVSARARRKAPPRNELSGPTPKRTPGRNGRRAPGSGQPGGRAKPLNAAQRAALPLHLHDLLLLFQADAGTRDCPRPTSAVVGQTTWGPLAAAACARIADYSAATLERCAHYDGWGGLEGDLVVHTRPSGGDEATRQGWSPAHRQQWFDPFQEDETSVENPSALEPELVMRDPLQGKKALREGVALLLRGDPYGDLDPAQRCALLRTLIDAVLQTKEAQKVIDERSRRLQSMEVTQYNNQQKKLQDDNMRCRRRAQDSRRDLDIAAPPKLQSAVIDDEGGFFAAARLAELDASSARGLLRCRLEEHRDAECLALLDESLKRCAVYDKAPYDYNEDVERNKAALKAVEDASKAMDVERLRNALLSARRQPGLASPPNQDPNQLAWVLRPLATGALLLRDLEYDAVAIRAIKADEAQARALPSLRAEPVGRDVTGNCHWAFRGEREYKYAPQRIWVQQSPANAENNEGKKCPSWGYYGDAAAVSALCRHLDRDDPSEARLRDHLLLRVPPGVAEWRG